MAIRPGAKKLIKEKPNTSTLSFHKASVSTDKNNKLDTSGDKSVCAQTIRNLLISLKYKLYAPIQFTMPTLLSFI